MVQQSTSIRGINRVTEQLQQDMVARPAEQAELPQADTGDSFPRLSSRCLITFEIGEETLLWNVIPLKYRRKRSDLIRGIAEVGYSDFEQLAAWFESFWIHCGSAKHRIRILVSGSDILNRTFTAPIVPKNELSTVVVSQAKQVFPFDVSQGLFGWGLLETVKKGDRKVYSIHGQALGNQWHSYLNRLLGQRIEDLVYVGSSSHQLERILRATAPGFKDEDSCLVRLRGTIFEVALFFNGKLEFFREAPLEAMSGGGTLAALRSMAGLVNDPAEADSQGLGVDEIKRFVRDALDFYYGQFSQRRIRTAYLCLPPQYLTEMSDFISPRIEGEIHDLNTEPSIARHSKKSGVKLLADDYPMWLTSLPNRKSHSSTTVDMSPDFLKEHRSERRRFSYALVGLVCSVLVVMTLTALQMIRVGNIQGELDLRESMVQEILQDPVLGRLEAERQRTEHLAQDLLPVWEKPSDELVLTMQVFSEVATNPVRLETMRLWREEGSACMVEITGIVIGPNDRQEPQLYAYMKNLRDNSNVTSVELSSKNSDVQFGRKTLHFSMLAEVAR